MSSRSPRNRASGRWLYGLTPMLLFLAPILSQAQQITQEFSDPGPEARGLAYGEGCLWASDPQTDTIYRISLNFQIVGGDVNGDGSVNVLDVLTVINHILGVQVLEGESLEWADFNGDGNINVLDALGVVNSILRTGECHSPSLPSSMNCELKSRSNMD